jgi:hypothetical protein
MEKLKMQTKQQNMPPMDGPTPVLPELGVTYSEIARVAPSMQNSLCSVSQSRGETIDAARHVINM